MWETVCPSADWVLFHDSHFAGGLADSKSTSSEMECIFGCHADFVPTGWHVRPKEALAKRGIGEKKALAKRGIGGTGQERNWPKEELAKRETGQKRNWPKEELAKRGIGQKRNWPTEELAKRGHYHLVALFDMLDQTTFSFNHVGSFRFAI